MQERQDLLNNLLKKELTELKRICFKYKHDTPFISNKIVILYDDISETENASGTWEKIEGSNKHDFTHKITIDNGLIDKYINFKPSYSDKIFKFGKKYYKKLLRQVIRHELIHAFVAERYQFITGIDNAQADASPIFMSILLWCKGVSNHYCANAFKNSDLYKKVLKFETFDQLDFFIFNMLIDYRDVNKRLKEYKLLGDTMMINSIEFSSRNPGIANKMQIKTRYLSKDKTEIKGIEQNIFEVGCCIMPNQIEPLIYKKRCGQFKHFVYEKMAVNNENKKVATIYKKVVGF